MENACDSSEVYREAMIGILETYCKRCVDEAVEKYGPVMGPLSISPNVILLTSSIERRRSVLLSEALANSQRTLIDYRLKVREVFQKD